MLKSKFDKLIELTIGWLTDGAAALRRRRYPYKVNYNIAESKEYEEIYKWIALNIEDYEKTVWLDADFNKISHDQDFVFISLTFRFRRKQDAVAFVFNFF